MDEIKENKGRVKRLVSVMEELNDSELILLLCAVLFLFHVYYNIYVCVIMCVICNFPHHYFKALFIYMLFILISLLYARFHSHLISFSYSRYSSNINKSIKIYINLLCQFGVS